MLLQLHSRHKSFLILLKMKRMWCWLDTFVLHTSLLLRCCCSSHATTTQVTRNPTECSEEVRLLLVQLLSIVLGQAGSAVAAYASEVWSMLSAALADNHHEVAMQGCKVAQQLAGGWWFTPAVWRRYFWLCSIMYGISMPELTLCCMLLRIRARTDISLSCSPAATSLSLNIDITAVSGLSSSVRPHGCCRLITHPVTTLRHKTAASRHGSCTPFCHL